MEEEAQFLQEQLVKCEDEINEIFGEVKTAKEGKKRG